MSKKPPKPETNGEVRKETIKPERLASLFASSRDLSLLSGKTNQRAQTNNKKSYAPNLNVTRNKNTEKASEKETTRKDHRSERGKNQRGRGGRGAGGANRGRMIQEAGLFSEGIAVVPVGRRAGGDHYGGGSSRESNIAEILQKPRIVNRDQKPLKADLDAEQKTLIDLLGEGGEDELDLDEEDSKTSFDDFLPIKIKNSSKRSVALTSKKLITDVKIKTEPIDDDVVMAISDSPENSLINGISIKLEPAHDVKSEEFHRMDKLFEATPNEFMLFQLPDTLPGRAPDAVDITQEPSTSSSKSQAPNLCSLEHLEEGLVGKLVRYKSGKTKLVLGDTYYDVDLGLTSDFQQHAVTINANINERSASLYSLGQINAKYNVSPDWIHLFHKMTP